MDKGRNILKVAYTFIIVVIYLLFFSVQCIFKYTNLSEYADTATALVSAAGKAGSHTAKFERGHHTANDASVRLNKRFHPENSFFIAPLVQVTPAVYTEVLYYCSFYENPPQSLVCLSKSLRAPPVRA